MEELSVMAGCTFILVYDEANWQGQQLALGF